MIKGCKMMQIDIRLYICKYLYKELAVRHVDIVLYVFLSYNHRQPILKSRQEQFDCPSNEFYKFHTPSHSYFDQPQKFLGLFLTRFSRQILGS